MSEAEHFLNNHKRRLSALGYGNLTIGKGKGLIADLYLDEKYNGPLQWIKEKGRRGGFAKGKGG